MSRFYLIGGHDFDSKNNYIAKRLLRLSHKEKPNILLIPLASKDSERTISNFKREYNGLNYTLNILLLTKKPNCDEIKEIITQADILFFSGGLNGFFNWIFKEK